MTRCRALFLEEFRRSGNIARATRHAGIAVLKLLDDPIPEGRAAHLPGRGPAVGHDAVYRAVGRLRRLRHGTGDVLVRRHPCRAADSAPGVHSLATVSPDVEPVM